jgi:hypothetical protein
MRLLTTTICWYCHLLTAVCRPVLLWSASGGWYYCSPGASSCLAWPCETSADPSAGGPGSVVVPTCACCCPCGLNHFQTLSLPGQHHRPLRVSSRGRKCVAKRSLLTSRHHPGVCSQWTGSARGCRVLAASRIEFRSLKRCETRQETLLRCAAREPIAPSGLLPQKDRGLSDGLLKLL